MNPFNFGTSRNRKFGKGFVYILFGFTSLILSQGLFEHVVAQPLTGVTLESAERLAITIVQTECPTSCLRSGKCDKSCRQRYYGERGTMEMINLRESRALSSALPVEVAVIDQSKFCAKETVQFRTPAGPVLLTNHQEFKGSFSDHPLCNMNYGYNPASVPMPPNQPYAPYDHTSLTIDGCYEVVNRYEREVTYNPPTIIGPVRYTCSEDTSNKTVSWQLTRGCSLSWSAYVRNTGTVHEISRVQVGCFAAQEPPEPPILGGGGDGGDGSGGAY